jgi:hypothetical protein
MPTAKVESKPEAKSQAKPEIKTSPDLTPQIAKRAYELYEERTRKGGRADQDWEEAEREIQKETAQTEPKSEAKSEPKAEARAVTPAELDGDSKPEVKLTTSPKAKREPKTEAEANPKAEANADPKSKAEQAGELNLHIVKRVHELYETLGREDVRAVEAWEKTEPKTPENEPHK